MALLALALGTAYLALVFVAGAITRRRRFGTTGLTGVSGRPVDEHVADALFLLAMALGLAGPAVALVTGLPVADPAIPVVGVGGLLVADAALLALVAQRTMGPAWRTGVDRTADDPLVTTGPFAVVRNPVYTSFLAAWAGVALIAPTVPGAVALVVLLAGLELQTRRVEEPFLLARHGDAYRDYAARVGRFLPRLGRLG